MAAPIAITAIPMGLFIKLNAVPKTVAAFPVAEKTVESAFTPLTAYAIPCTKFMILNAAMAPTTPAIMGINSSHSSSFWYTVIAASITPIAASTTAGIACFAIKEITGFAFSNARKSLSFRSSVTSTTLSITGLFSSTAALIF